MGVLQIFWTGGAAQRGLIAYGNLVFPCALGRGGVSARKREGDGATPRGRWIARQVLYRGDRVARPLTPLPIRAIRAHDGWCDDPADRNYNRPVPLPYPTSAERLARQDRLYDIIVPLGYNDIPRSKGRGSAIFMHVARRNFTPTEGCIALKHRDLVKLLRHIRPGDEIDTGATPRPVRYLGRRGLR
jgi:L,D-peptidoglycan transpeptidase YkuD (ErfK/YbiS/YcfS/YnhG family)